MNKFTYIPKKVDQCVYIIFVLTIVFGILLHNVLGLKTADEMCVLLMIGVFIYYMFSQKNWDINKGFLSVLFIFLFYLGYSIYIQSNSTKGIFYDFLIQMKPYLIFFSVYQILPVFGEKEKKILKDICLVVWFLCVPFGIYGLMNIRILSIIWEHPTNYATVITTLALTYLFLGDYSKKERFIFIIMLSAGFASGRAKFYGFFVLAVFVVLYLDNVKKTRFNLKTVILLITLTLAIGVAARDKINLYFFQSFSGEEKELVARAALYITSFDLFQDYFPFGTGYASFGTHASGLFYSDIYDSYNISGVWGLTKDEPDFVSDTYYPSLAQFGVVGLILYFFFWIFYISKSYKYMRQTENMHYFVIFLIITGSLFIKNIAEATITGNEGVFMMFLLALTLGTQKQLYFNTINSKYNGKNISDRRSGDDRLQSC